MRQILKPINTDDSGGGISCFCSNNHHHCPTDEPKTLQFHRENSFLKSVHQKENNCVGSSPIPEWTTSIEHVQPAQQVVVSSSSSSSSSCYSSTPNRIHQRERLSPIPSTRTTSAPSSKMAHNGGHYYYYDRWFRLVCRMMMMLVNNFLMKLRQNCRGPELGHTFTITTFGMFNKIHCLFTNQTKQGQQQRPRRLSTTRTLSLTRILAHQNCSPTFSSIMIMIPILSLIILCYQNSLSGDFVHDDIPAIVQNPDVLGTTTIRQLFANDFWGHPMSNPQSHKSYRPITTLTFRLNMMISVHPFGFHLVNLFLHILTTMLVCCLTRKVFHFDWNQTTIAGCLFAIHPIHCEAVSSIVGRADVLCAFFYLIAFLLFHLSLQPSFMVSAKRQWPLLLMFSLATTMALLSKEIGITVLGCCAFYWCWWWRWRIYPSQRSRIQHHTLRPIFMIILSFLILMSFRLSMNQNHQDDQNNVTGDHWSLPLFTRQDNPAAHSGSLWTRSLTYLHLAWFNFQLILCPLNQSYDWQTSSIRLIETLWDARNITTVAFLVMVSWWIWRLFGFYHRKQRQESPPETEAGKLSEIMSLLLLVLPYLPASNLFITVGFVVAERLLYIPSIGFICLVCIGMKRLEMIESKMAASMYRSRTISRIIHSVRQYGLLIMISVFTIKTIQQNQVWHCRESLYKSAIVNVPENAKAHYNYGNLQQDIGNWNDAIHHYQTAIRLWPEHASAHNNLGTLFWKTGQPFEAEKHFQQALKINPYHAKAHFNLGKVFSKRGQTLEAIRLMERSIGLDPDFGESYEALATLLTHFGHELLAQRFYLKAIRLRSRNADFHNNYGAFLQKTGRFEYARHHYHRALELRPKHWIALVNMARLCAKLNQFSRAEHFYKRAMTLKQDPTTMDSLGTLYLQRLKLIQARDVYKRLWTSSSSTPSIDDNNNNNNKKEDRSTANRKQNESTATTPPTMIPPLANIHYAQLLILEGKFRDAEVLLEALTTRFVNNNQNNNDNHRNRRNRSNNNSNGRNNGKKNDGANIIINQEMREKKNPKDSSGMMMMMAAQDGRNRQENQIQMLPVDNKRKTSWKSLPSSSLSSKGKANNNQFKQDEIEMDVGHLLVLAPDVDTSNSSSFRNKTKASTQQRKQSKQSSSSSSKDSSIGWNVGVQFQIDVYHQLALLHTLTNRTTEALNSIAKALESCRLSIVANEMGTRTIPTMVDLIGNRCAQIYTLQGDLQKDLHQWSAAIQSYKQALLLDECLPRAHLHLAVCHHLMNQYQLAMLHYSSALQLDSIGTNRLLIKENLAKLRYHMRRLMIAQKQDWSDDDHVAKSESKSQTRATNLGQHCSARLFRAKTARLVVDNPTSPLSYMDLQASLSGLADSRAMFATSEIFTKTNSNVVSFSSTSIISSY